MALRRGRVDVVGDQQFHSFHLRGQVAGELTAQVAGEEPGLDRGKQSREDAPAEVFLHLIQRKRRLARVSNRAGNQRRDGG